MPRLAASICIAAPATLVFQALEQPVRPLFPHGELVLHRTDPSGGEGARYRWEFCRFGLHYQLESTVTAFKPGELISWKGTEGWDMTAEVTLWPERGGTCLFFGIRYQLPWPLRWLMPGPLIRLGVWHALHQIKRETESRRNMLALT